MPEEPTTTRWRDTPLTPSNYDDLRALAALARKTRSCVVDFNWPFTKDDLLRLRRAVFEWGTATAGRYRAFDARVLAAINRTLDDARSPFVLNDPGGAAGLEATVRCVASGDGYRLVGHAPFDVVFGYGRAGADSNWEAELGPTLQARLVDYVSPLGWDIRRLGQQTYRPVTNVLYGLPTAYGISQPVTATDSPVIDVPLHFHGPFAAHDSDVRCLLTDPIAGKSGIYLWTVEVEGQHRVWYVGQTRRAFSQRMAEHVAGFLSGQYLTYDTSALLRGENYLADGVVAGSWPEMLPTFLRRYEQLAPQIASLLRVLRFHVAPLDAGVRLHDQIEGAIGRALKKSKDNAVSTFITPGLKLPAAMPGERPIRLLLTTDVPIAGLSDQLMA